MKAKRFKSEPTVIVVFGGTGDLSKKKLIPALLHLFAEGFLPEVFRIVGISRKDFSNEDFRQFMREALERKKHHYKKETIEKFLKNAYYQKGAFDDPQTYKNLSAILAKLDNEEGFCLNKLFYLSVQPSLYEAIFKNLADSGFAISCRGQSGWTRVLVEKPFGNDLKTAQALDKILTSFFKEEQIFRIDHYLAKDAVQNLLTFRFSNVLFEDSWDARHVEKVLIKLYENFGVEGRGSFYDESGALRDVGQNHLLQMLALIAMDNPVQLKPQNLREKKSETLEALRIYSAKEARLNAARCQYEGYKSADGVAKNSKTETYFRLRAFVDNDRWRGVPFYLESGKGLSETKTEIQIYFKSSAPCACGIEDGHEHQNVLTLGISPEQSVTMRFWVKKPGIIFSMEPQNLIFNYSQEANGSSRLPDAYEKVLFDCISGDQTLFASSREVEAAWRFITPILEAWKEGGELCVYKPGQMPEVKLPV